MRIKEDFLHYLWKLKKIDLSNLITTNDELVTIIDFGTHNMDSGPDFFNAKVKIGETLWVGNIEMHIKASDWIKHNHDKDTAYNNVILHVVYEADSTIKTKSGFAIPTLELKRRILKNDLRNYKLLRFNKHWIPCEKFITSTDQMTRISALEKTLTDRLINKSGKLKQLLIKKEQNWSEAFYIFLLRYFGMKVNTDAFEMLASSLPYNIILKERDNLLKTEALLFGQAGLLDEDFKDNYPRELKKEYKHLKNKYNLNPIPISIWKYSKLRPPNFPTIRIAQLAEILNRETHIFSKVLESENIKIIRKLFKAKTTGYWKNHYLFDENSIERKKSLGTNAIDILIINTVVPTLFLYGLFNGRIEFKDKAIDYLSEIKPEKNSIINKWKNLGFIIKSSYDSQALLELKLNYCNKHKCLNCPIGNKIMNSN